MTLTIGGTDMTVGLNQLLGVEFIDLGPDGGRAQVRIDERHHQPWGIVHGGLYCTIAETVASIAGKLWLDTQSGGSCVGVNNNTDFLRAVSSGIVTATTTPIHRGRRQQLWLIEMTDESERMLARGQVRLQNV